MAAFLDRRWMCMDLSAYSMFCMADDVEWKDAFKLVVE